MMNDFVEEEMEIMNERTAETEHHKINNGIEIEDPIKTLNLIPVVKVKETVTVKDTIEVLNDKNIGCVVVENDAGDTVGIFTERDILRRVIGRGLDLAKEQIKAYMTKDPECLSEDDPITFALNKMSAGSYRHIPVTKNNKVKYMLSVKDIVDHISITYRNSVLNLPPNLNQETSEYGG